MGRADSGKKDRTPSRADRFWSSFLFTENGKPKSSYGVYTFSLSVLFSVIHVACWLGATELENRWLAGMDAGTADLLTALAAAAVGAAVCCSVHFLTRDKRLVFGAYLWLCVYVLVSLAAVDIIMLGSAATWDFLRFWGLSAVLPAALGTLVSWLLRRRDHHPEAKSEQEPEWKKYVDRR